MIRRLAIYLQFRRQGLRRAWHFAGMNALILPTIRVVVLAALACFAFSLVANQAAAIEAASRAESAEKIHDQAALIDNLSKFLSACLGPSEGAFWIGNELHLCHATPTGVKR